MAAGLVVSPLVDALINNLSSAIWEEVGSIWSVKDEIQKLQRLLTHINLVLEDAERRSRSTNDGALHKWLKDLKDTAFDADDVLDEFHTEVLGRRMDMRHPIKRKFDDFLSLGSSLFFRSEMAHKIKELLTRFDEIAEVKAKFHLIEGCSPVQHPERETFSLVEESEIFGRNDDKVKMMEWLMNIEDSDEKDVAILPLVGLGGVGKTTLAQLVYNDENVKRHFDNNQMWVCVAEEFDVKVIVKAILERATKTQCVFSRLEDIQQLLKEKLKGKRYLLVLDDVWNEDASKWETLKLILGSYMEGSKIIVTTRSQRVADITSTTGSSYKLKVLSDDDNWNLFKKRAFGPGREKETPNLVHIGKEIVKRCGGLPLAAKALGCLMATKRGETEWSSVKNSDIWRLGDANKEVLPALQLSYDHLSPQLKRCFAYCSVFPKDFRIDKLKLIQLWIAEGLVQSEEGMHVEDIGNQYFNMLLWRSFFQEEQEQEFFGIVSCKMHDLVHDLACFVAKDESCIVEVGGKSSISCGCRYLSVIFREGFLSPAVVKKVQEAKHLRSLLLLGSFNYQGTGEHALWDAISNLTRLRVLYLSDCHIKTIDHIVGKFKHLRFLDLSNSEIDLLPDSITNLYNMQTLNLRNCCELLQLPKNIQNMSYLRHLDIGSKWTLPRLGSWTCDTLKNLESMPCGLSRLTNLRTLPWFIVGEGSGHLTIGDLQHLNQIRGRLIIYNLQNVKDPIDAKRAKLSSKVDLQRLGLCWEGSREEPQASDDNVLLEILQPPHNLKYLRIEGYGGNRFPNWFMKRDPFSLYNNLVELVLLSLIRCEELPPLGQLPSLERLTLSGMHGIKKIGAEVYGESNTTCFAMLKFLSLEYMSNLEEWSVLDGEMFPCLERLHIVCCPKLRMQPFMPSSIVVLYIIKSNEELLAAGEGVCLQGLSNLRTLHFGSMEASKTNWKGLQYLINLKKLRIIRCRSLKSLPNGILQHHFLSLQTLVIDDCLESLSESEQQEQPPPLFMSLHHLTLTCCQELTALPNWLSRLTALESLELQFCNKLEMLPIGFEQLTGLKKLTITGNSILANRCEKKRGEDWHKISHIPNINISISHSNLLYSWFY